MDDKRASVWGAGLVLVMVLACLASVVTVLASWVSNNPPSGVGGQIVLPSTPPNPPTSGRGGGGDPDLQDHLPVNKRVYIVETVSSSWKVGPAVKYIDGFATSRASIVKKCPVDAWRCIVIRKGKLAGAPVGWASWTYKGATITIDEAKAKKRHWSAANRRYLLVHEIGHAYFLEHVTTCSVMNKYRTCKGKPTPATLEPLQRTALANW